MTPAPPRNTPAASLQVPRGGSRLQSRTVVVEDADLFQFLAEHEGAPRFLYWGPEEATAGVGVAAEVRVQGSEPFEAVRRQAQEVLDRLEHERSPEVPLEVQPRWIGGFAFDPNSGSNAEWPAAHFVLPARQLTLFRGRVYLTLTGPSPKPPAVATQVGSPEGAVPPWIPEPTFETWTRAVRTTLEAIRDGRIEKAVLARTLSTTLPQPPFLPRIVAALAKQIPTVRTFLVEPQAGHAFLGASPELLLRCEGNLLETAAIAGSRPRGQTAVEDQALSRALLASSKDAWEHELVSRYVRRFLEARGVSWATPVERGLLRLPHVQHLETRFVSKLQPGEHVLDLARRLHPTPAVAGSPLPEALTLLQELESVPRHWYAGVVGWFDASGQGELSVAIRAAHVRERSVVLYAGCGIVEGSDPAEEWEESRAKFQLLRDAFTPQEAPPS